MIRALFFVLLGFYCVPADFSVGSDGSDQSDMSDGHIRRIAAVVSNLSGRAAVWLSGLFCLWREFYADGSWHFYGVAGG